ncbi:hypothetical protein KY290_031971 [Solanum tuberosum]|uniref:Transposase, Ptta/En/Spm, plant n=1 Tax=Solanum tuberosum TaxID=4113 RepID=A0ABQ7UBU8_SOLTU|nr:hypothetical protein KY290_031971 [Solanum tuberosum]
MPDSYLDRVFDEFLMARFLFMIDYQKAKKWAGSNLNKKWKDHRHKLWHAAKNPLLSKEDIIRKSPNGIPMDQWALFVNYRMDEKTQKLCKKNQQIRQNQIPHTGGVKSLARRRAEMMAKGKVVDRGKMWTETHKRKDGSYVTEAAREIVEKIEEIRSQRPESIVEVSPNDALGIVLGPEHPGCIRGLGLGVVPTMAFKQTSRRFKHVNVSSSSSSNPTPKWQQEMTSMKSQLNALLTLYQKNIGNIPEEFAYLFPPPPQV